MTDKPDQTALEAVRALGELASPRPWPAIRERSRRGTADRAYAALAVNSIDAAVEALEWIESNCRWGHESINEAWDDLHTIVAIAREVLAAIKDAAQEAT
jgi:hypothetical protein